MVISVDTGNKMIKTEHYEFNSGIDVLDTIPGENDEVIEFGGKYYRTTNRRISYMEDKTEDDRYYILTLIAIAKELDTMKKEAVLAPNELIEIELLVGLPPAHYGKYRKSFSSISIDNIILGKNTGYMQELKERVREVTIGYVTELLGTFRELGIDFRTTQTVFMGGGAILVSEIIKVVWERFKGEYFIINDPKANAKGYKLQFQIEAKERED